MDALRLIVLLNYIAGMIYFGVRLFSTEHNKKVEKYLEAIGFFAIAHALFALNEAYIGG